MLVRRTRLLITLVFITMVFITSCSKNSNESLLESQSIPGMISNTPIIDSSTPQTTIMDNNHEQLQNKITNAISIDDPKSWIESTTPDDSATDVGYSSSISIKFKYDMDKISLNENNIIIQEAKHSSIISNLFNYKYNKETRTLKIDFKVYGNGYGTSNSVLVLLSGDIKNSQNEHMGIDIRFGFITK